MIEGNKLPRYIILESGESCSILKIKTLRGKKDSYEIYMPDVGSINNARFVLEAIRKRVEENLEKHERLEEEFKVRLKKPHSFVRASLQSSMCYCEKEESDEIHISEEEEERVNLTNEH